MLDALILRKGLPSDPRDPNVLVQSRLQQFRAGNIQTLLGGIGSMAHQLLFQPSQAPFPAPLPTPANCLSSALFPPIHQRARNIQPHILTQATHHWKADNPIGTTHHSRSPVQWAMQVLSLNLTRAYAKHLCFHLDRCVQAHLTTESDHLPFIEGCHNIPFDSNLQVSGAKDTTVVVV